jgi:hypothetical protein
VQLSNKLYGVTHTPDGQPILRDVKNCKVGIGLPKGRDIHVCITPDGNWKVKIGKDAKEFKSKDEARIFYRQARPNAPERKFPVKIAYFTFGKMGVEGNYEPDFDAIEKHGPLPTEVPIIFTSDEPFKARYQMWGSAELKCEGDGINARRIGSMAQTAEEKKAMEAALAAGSKYFELERRCFLYNCPYSKTPDPNKPPACKQHGRLLFQLISSPVLGGSAVFDTTGYRSIRQLFSCIETFKGFTGGYVAGIPLVMVLRPYKVTHNGQGGTQYGVSLEFRANTAGELKRSLLMAANDFRISGQSQTLSLPAVGPTGDSAEPPEENAAAMNAEFPAGEIDEATGEVKSRMVTEEDPITDDDIPF